MLDQLLLILSLLAIAGSAFLNVRELVGQPVPFFSCVLRARLLGSSQVFSQLGELDGYLLILLLVVLVRFLGLLGGGSGACCDVEV